MRPSWTAASGACESREHGSRLDVTTVSWWSLITGQRGGGAVEELTRLLL